MHVMRIGGFVLLAAVAGCGDVFGPAYGLEVVPMDTVVVVGDPLRFQVTNTGRNMVHLGMCPGAVVRRDDPSEHILLDGVCPAALRALAPDQTFTIGINPQPLEAGEYRAVVSYVGQNGSGRSVSSVFRIEGT